MGIETLGFIVGVIGAVLVKASMGEMRRPPGLPALGSIPGPGTGKSRA